MTHPLDDFRDRERVRLVESDLALTNEFVRGVVTTGTAVRSIGVTIWLALLGIALPQDVPSLAVLAAAVPAIFWVVDGYYGWLYEEASVHARACERVLSDYHNTIGRAVDDPGVVERFRTTLRLHRFGLFLGFRSGYGVKEWWSARPTLLYRTLYPAMVAGAAAVALLLKLSGPSP